MQRLSPSVQERDAALFQSKMDSAVMDEIAKLPEAWRVKKEKKSSPQPALTSSQPHPMGEVTGTAVELEYEHEASAMYDTKWKGYGKRGLPAQEFQVVTKNEEKSRSIPVDQADPESIAALAAMKGVSVEEFRKMHPVIETGSSIEEAYEEEGNDIDTEREEKIEEETAEEQIARVEKAEVTGTKKELNEKIEALRQGVETARGIYAQDLVIQDEEQGLFKKVLNFFPKVKMEHDPALQEGESKYKQALMALHDAELEEIKKSGLTGKALHEKMAESLRYYQIDEFTKLYNAQIDAKLAKREKSIAGQTVTRLEKALAWYKKLSTKEKILISSGLVLGTAVFTVAGAFTAAGLVIGTRRVLTGALLASASHQIMEGRSGKKREKGLQESFEQSMKLDTEEKEDGEFLEGKFEHYLDSIDKRIKEWQKEDRNRKYLAAAIGVGGGLALSEGAAYAMEESGANASLRKGFGKLGIFLTADEAAKGATGTPKTGDLSIGNKEANFSKGPGVESAASVESGGRATAPTPTVEHAAEFEGYLKEGRIPKTGDSLWKYSTQLGKQLGLSGAQEMRFAMLVEEQIREKIAENPELREKAGFMNDRLHLRSGKPINLNIVLNPVELEEITKEASRGSARMGNLAPQLEHEGKPEIKTTSHTTVIEETLEARNNTLIEDVKKANAMDGMKAETFIEKEAPGESKTSLRMTQTEELNVAADRAEAVKAFTDVKAEPKSVMNERLLKEFGPKNVDMNDFIRKLPREEGYLFRGAYTRLARDILWINPKEFPGDLRVERSSFATTDNFGRPVLNRAVFETQVAEIIEDYDKFQKNGLVVYRRQNPLHVAQWERVIDLIRDSQKQFGHAADPGAGEDLKNYLARMTALRFYSKKPLVD